MHPTPFCPDLSLWRLGEITLGPDRIVLHLEPVREVVPCPVCGTHSRRIHSWYHRIPWDLPWGRWPVRLVVHARRFFCDAPSCPRRIFVEPFPTVLIRYARQTERLRQVLLELAHASSAERAAQVARLLGYVTSPDSLIRLQRREQMSVPTPRVVGLDEFALKRGRTYSTLLVDLEAHRPVDVLESRQAEPIVEWLTAHPGVEILARDRAEAYAQAGHTATPDAVQVADRFHLVRNVGDALKAVVSSQQWTVPAAEDALGGPLPEQPVPTQHTPAPPTVSQPTPRKRALWEAVQQRRAQGQPLKAIARELELNVKTVRKYVATDQPPVCRSRCPRLTKLTPYLVYLQQRWQQGCYNARQLAQEIRQHGYTGSLSQVRATVHPWRETPPSARSRSMISFYWLVRCPLPQVTKTEQADLARFLAANPPLALGHRLKEDFHRLVKQRDPVTFDHWLHEAEASGLPPFQALAASFRQDLAAIMQAITTPWSTAQCEGQICRVKLIKRLGYGRANPDLLRQRILHRAVGS